MRAVMIRGGHIVVGKMHDPRPMRGQILVAPLFAGICGSDLHLRHEMREAWSASSGTDRSVLPTIIPGHEFSAEVIEIGAGTETSFKIGDRIVPLPFTPTPSGMRCIGLSEERSGGMATLCVVDAERTFLVPDAIDSELAALTEPLSVGLHAVNLARRNKGPNIVIGCGPIGLAVLLALKAQGRGPILAVDFSKERREMAARLGADIIIDPAETSPYTSLTDLQFTPDPASPLLAREFSGLPRGVNIFECTGAPSVLKDITQNAPQHSHVIYAGVHSHDIKHTPLDATLRELAIDYSFAYTHREFGQALKLIGENPEKVSQLITSRVPLDKTETAFDLLAGTPTEVKVLIDVRG